MSNDYVSPFRFPPSVPRCTNPVEAKFHPHYHSLAKADDYWGSPCPVHLHKMSAEPLPQPAHAWVQWYKAREAFAAGDERSYQEMLSQVTEDNPPDAPSTTVAKRRRLHGSDWLVIGILAGVLCLFLVAVAGAVTSSF